MSMDHPEGFGSASASEVPARPPGPGYNFRPRSRSAAAPKNRRLGSVELQGVGSTLDLPAITPPISPTPSGAGNPTHVHIPTLVSHDSTPSSSLRYSTLYANTRSAVHSCSCYRPMLSRVKRIYKRFWLVRQSVIRLLQGL